MPSRELIYRVTVATGDGKRQARALRNALESELRQIKLGEIDTSSFQKATQAAQAYRQELERVNETQKKRPGSTSADESAVVTLKKIAAGYLTLQAAQLAIGKAVELTQLATQAARAGKSFEILSGGAAKAEANIAAIQRVSNGTVSSLQAAQIGTQAFSLGLAKNAADLEKLTRAARLVTTVSPTIRDMGDALTQLSLFASNEKSFMRADQLGLSVTEVKDRMKELQAQNDALDGSQAKLLASMQLLDEKFGDTLNTVEAQATGLEKLGIAWTELKIALGGLAAGPVNAVSDFIAGSFNEFTVMARGVKADATIIEAALKEVTEAYQNQSNILGNTPFVGDALKKDRLAVVGQLQEIQQIFKLSNEAVASDESLLPYQQAIREIVVEVTQWGYATDEQMGKLRQLYDLMAKQQAANKPQVDAAAAEAARAQAEQDRIKRILDNEQSIIDAIEARAKKSVPTAGLEATIAQMQQQKELLDQAWQTLINAGSTDSGELALRVEDLTNQLLAPFDELDERAKQLSFNEVVAGFDTLSVGLEGINAGFTDFLPGVSGVRDELIGLSEELAFTGQMTEEQAAALDYYNGVAAAVADDTSLLGQVTAELGEDFLASNEYAAALVDQLYQAEGAYQAGLITGDVYAGIMAVLSGRLLTVAQAAGIATGAISRLNAAQGGRASAQGIVIGGQVADRIQLAQAERERNANRREQERLAKEQERAAKRTAAEQERGAKRAAKAIEDGARKANQELESMLKKVPGLFGTSQVTDEDMRKTKLGTYINKADEYLRRLRDEVENGTDWADVSIEDAKAALERVGIRAGDSAEAILQQFEEAWDTSVLFSDKANLSFINKEAVQMQQDLADKAKQGEKNILEYFGVVVDDAVDAVTGGGDGSSDIEIEPATFQTSAATVEESIKSGADEVFKKTALSIKESFARNKGNNSFFDPQILFGAAGNEKSVMGPLPKEITITADASAKPIADFLAAGATAAQGTAIAQALPTLQPTLPADAGEQLAKDLGDQLAKQVDIFLSHGATVGRALLVGMSQSLSVDANGKAQVDIAGFIGNNLNAQVKTFVAQGSGIAGLLRQGIDEGLSLDAQGSAQVDIAAFLADNLSAQGKTFIAQGGGIADLLKRGMSEALAVSAEGNASIDFAGFIGNNLTAQANTFIAQGRGIAGLLQQGVDEVIKPAEKEGEQASGIAVKIASLTLAEGVRAPDVSVMGKLDTFAIDQTALLNAKLSVPVELKIPQQQTNADGSAGANAITPLITDINTQIRTKQKEIGAQGITIAQIIMAAIVAHFKGTQQAAGGGGEGQSATPLADAMLTAVSTQFTTTQNMFYAAGFLPASAVESGFKGYAYTGLAESFRDALTSGIRGIGADLSQRGGTMAAYVQGGFVTAFNSEAFKAQLIAVGELMYTYIEMGILAKVNGGKLTAAIGAQVIEDLNTELEQP